MHEACTATQKQSGTQAASAASLIALGLQNIGQLLCGLQAFTVDSAVEHQKVKQDLQSKLGVPSAFKRLFFKVPRNPELGEADTAAQTQELLEDLTAGLKDWQVKACLSSFFEASGSHHFSG